MNSDVLVFPDNEKLRFQSVNEGIAWREAVFPKMPPPFVIYPVCVLFMFVCFLFMFV